MAKTTKTTKTGTAPVSKYAAKKAMLAKGIIPTPTIANTNVETKVNSTTLAQIWEKYKDTPFMKIVKDISSGDLKNDDEILKEIERQIALEKNNETATTAKQVGEVLIVGNGPISGALENKVANQIAKNSTYGVSSDKDDWHRKVEESITEGNVSVDNGTAIHKAIDADMKRQMDDHKKIADEITKDGQSIMKEIENVMDDMLNDLTKPNAVSDTDFDKVRLRIKSSKLLVTAYGRQTLYKEIHDFMNQGMISTSQGLELLAIVNYELSKDLSKKVKEVEVRKDDADIPKSKLDKLQSMVTKRDPIKKKQVIPTEVDTHATINPNSKDKRKSGLPDSSAPYPEHVTELALLMKNNAEIRRFTALAIVTYLAQKKIISGNRPNVTFKWDNFTVKVNGFQRTYKYTEAFFLNCLMVAFVSFSKSAQNTIGRFTKIEKNKEFVESIDLGEIGRLASLIEPKTKSK